MKTETMSLSHVAAQAIRAEAARRGWTQTEVARLLGMSKMAVSDRYRERTPWTLDEVEAVAELMHLEPAELLARPKGFEPLTFWLGADFTVTYWSENRDGEPVPNTSAATRRAFCDACGWDERGAAAWFLRAEEHAGSHKTESDSGALLPG